MSLYLIIFVIFHTLESCKLVFQKIETKKVKDLIT